MTDVFPISGKYIAAAIIFFAIIVCIAFMIIPIIGAYNGLVNADLQVQKCDSNIRTDLVRRADLIPNLVAVVSGSVNFEKSTLVEVIGMRAQATKIKEQVKSARSIDDIQQSQDEIGAVIGRLLMLTENYPQLQSTQQFRDLSAQITATENQILQDRQTYNLAVMQYQRIVRSFPTNLVAGFYNFDADKYSLFKPMDETRAYAVPIISFAIGSI